ncbi:flagellinolysin [Telluria mixta]|uniref:Flagellin n=1 Tax=Telluria mixta TaxID=34071 RepID=A0ABT2C973_9BURK|nr:flagellinolysin [Telluria mixta]MCS0633346.1 flagellinolysin [Telluria mixta]WEM96382.1 flagellinolysin [Telluria mixta]
MSLSINNQSLSLHAQRKLAEHTNEATRLVARLGSSARIENAADDPAGQAVVGRMRSQLTGMRQAMRSINDATSMLQVADSALSNITDNLQRLRELAVASGNGSYTDSDRDTLQAEANQILAQITQTGNGATFNGQAIFSPDATNGNEDKRKRAVLDSLKAGWLSAAEDMVQQYYGLQGDGVTLKINLDTTDGASGVLASVTGSTAPGSDVTLNVDMADFSDMSTPDGGTGPVYDDRVIAHEMVHAIMLRSTSFNFPQWFTEGTAELIHGADERLAGALAGGQTAQGIVDTITGGGFSYEGGYVASRYLHDQLKSMGVDGGMKGLMTYLSQHRSADLDTALNAVTGGQYQDIGDFMTDFAAHGASFIAGMDLTNADTGAIGGLDADGGPSRDARGVVPEAGFGTAAQPLRNFKVEYPNIGGQGEAIRRVQIQVGASAGDLVNMEFSAVNAGALGLADLDMHNTAVALLHIDDALASVTGQRVQVGAYSNRMDLAASNTQTASMNLEAARSRIEDVDYAGATVRLTRVQILQQAASAMLTQANGEPRAVLALLR